MSKTPIERGAEAVMSQIHRTGDFGQYASFRPETVTRAVFESIPDEWTANELEKHYPDLDQTAVYEGSCACDWRETIGDSDYNLHVARAIKAALLAEGGES